MTGAARAAAAIDGAGRAAADDGDVDRSLGHGRPPAAGVVGRPGRVAAIA